MYIREPYLWARGSAKRRGTVAIQGAVTFDVDDRGTYAEPAVSRFDDTVRRTSTTHR
jgi:hypothetical protein